MDIGSVEAGEICFLMLLIGLTLFVSWEVGFESQDTRFGLDLPVAVSRRYMESSKPSTHFAKAVHNRVEETMTESLIGWTDLTLADA